MTAATVNQDHGPDIGALLAAALEYASRGWHVFPIRPPIFGDGGTVRCTCESGADCGQIGKHPAVLWTTGGERDMPLRKRRATTNTDTVTEWWSKAPDCGIGISCGPSGLLVVDVDKWADGWATLGRLEQTKGFDYDTLRVITPSGGMHFYYRMPDPPVPSSTHVSRTAKGREDPIGPGMDIRGVGGMVVAPPSVHKTGGRYVWQHEVVPGGDTVVKLAG